MSEKQFMNVLKRVFDEKVKVDIYTSGHFYRSGYILDIGEDYVKFTYSLKKKYGESFIKLTCIESISTKWGE